MRSLSILLSFLLLVADLHVSVHVAASADGGSATQTFAGADADTLPGDDLPMGFADAECPHGCHHVHHFEAWSDPRGVHGSPNAARFSFRFAASAPSGVAAPPYRPPLIG